MPHVVVIGAGVIGLQSAINLQDAGHKVTIIAAHIPGDQTIDYTSPWAGAHWRTHASDDDHTQQSWDIQTYSAWSDLIALEATNPSLPKSGLKFYDSHTYWETAPKTAPWWTKHFSSYTAIPPSSTALPAHERTRIAEAGTFRAIAINVPTYLSHLLSTFRHKNGILLRFRIPQTTSLSQSLASIPSILQAHNLPAADAIVNATGLLAGALTHDTLLYPIRGQTVLVRGEASAIRSRIRRDGGMDYVIPRPGSNTTILGGTKEEGVWAAVPDGKATERILKGCEGLAPELLQTDGGFEVLSVQVGLRPGRKDGARMEVERVGEWRVVHAYGHAGAGYQNSIGVGRAVVGMVHEALGTEVAKL